MKSSNLIYQLSLHDLPAEIVTEILLNLTPEEIPIAALVSKQFAIILGQQNNVFWGIKFERHFPEIFKEMTAEDKIQDIDWYQTFRQTYLKQYKQLTPEEKKLFSLIKENRVYDIKAMMNQAALSLAALFKPDKDGIVALELIRMNKQQALLDYFYQLASEQYRGEDVNRMDEGNRTLLHWALLCRQPAEIIEKILLAGADCNATFEGRSPILIAALDGDTNIVKLLLSKGAQVDNIALYGAAQYGHLAVVKALIEAGANVNMSLDTGETPLLAAANSGHGDIVKYLLAQHANVEAKDVDHATAVHLAAEEGHVDILKELVAANAPVNIKTLNGDTPLYVAAQNGHLAAVQILLSAGSKVDAKIKSGATALHAATIHGSIELIKILINAGTDVNVQNKKGVTPIFIAAQNGDLAAVKLLVEHHADLTLTSSTDKKSLQKFAKYFDETIKARMMNFVDQQTASGKNLKLFADTAPIKISPLDIADILGYTQIVNQIQMQLNKTRLRQ